MTGTLLYDVSASSSVTGAMASSPLSSSPGTVLSAVHVVDDF